MDAQKIISTGVGNATLIAELNDILKAAHQRGELNADDLGTCNQKLQTLGAELATYPQDIPSLNGVLEDKVRDLKRAQADLENFLASIDIAIIFLDPHGNIRRFSPEATSLFQLVDADCGRNISCVSHCFDNDLDLMQDVEKVLRTQTRLETQMQCDQGYWYMRRVSIYRGVLGDVAGVVITFSDIDKLKRTSLALKASQARIRALYTHTPSMYFSLDESNRITALNHHGSQMLDRTETDTVGLEFTALHARPERVLRYLQQCREQDSPVTWEARMLVNHGRSLWLRCRGSQVSSVNGEQELLVVCEDVSVERDLRQQMSFRNTHDDLTGLLNRTGLEQALSQAARDASEADVSHAVCYLDLDKFKSINEMHGYPAGDELLRKVARRLRAASRKSDVLARISADEFVLLLKHCGWFEAQRAAEAMLEALRSEAFHWSEGSTHVTACIGVAPITPLGESPERVLQGASAACVLAKNAGANSIHLFSENDAELAQRQSDSRWATRLRSAFAQGQIEVYAQTVVDLGNSDTPPSYETLARIRDDKGQLWGPASFLPAAARHGLLGELDRAMVQQVLNYLGHHRGAVAPGRWVSINLSGSSLTSASFTRFLADAIAVSGVAPEQLCFEITETTMIDNMDHARAFIEDIRALGCKFALDDFGTGLASFQYLKELPMDFVKIDGSFVLDILTDPVDRAVVESINEIAHLKGKQTIAEFVETEHVAEQLKKMGVDMAQGYYYTKPAPIALVVVHTKDA